jgi:hypothetical protein
MKKTILILIIALVLVPAGLFAGIINLNIGATAQYKIPVTDVDDGMTDIENWAFGPDLRLRILFAEVGVAGLYTKLADDNAEFASGHQLSGLLTGGVSFDLLGFLRLGLGMGPRMEVLFSEDFASSKITVGGVNIDDVTFGDAFMNAPLTYRATVDFNLGRFLIGANYTIDSGGFTFENLDAEKLMPDFDNNKGTFGVSALFRIF